MGTKEIKVFFTTPQVGQLFEHPRCKEGAGPTGFGERSLRIAAVPFCCQRRFSNTEDTGWKEGQPVLIYENRPFYQGSKLEMLHRAQMKLDISKSFLIPI